MSNYNLSTTKSFNIELKDNTLDEYDDLLSRFNNWIENKREIKLNSIFLDKKIEVYISIGFVIYLVKRSMTCLSSRISKLFNA